MGGQANICGGMMFHKPTGNRFFHSASRRTAFELQRIDEVIMPQFSQRQLDDSVAVFGRG